MPQAHEGGAGLGGAEVVYSRLPAPWVLGHRNKEGLAKKLLEVGAPATLSALFSRPQPP